jgi:hypothetical protein
MCLSRSTTRDDIRKPDPSSLGSHYDVDTKRRLGVTTPSPLSAFGVIAAAEATPDDAATGIIPAH